MTGVEPLQLVEWSIVFSIVVLPLTYLPLLLIANDKKFMGDKANGWIANLWAGASTPRCWRRRSRRCRSIS